MSKAVKKQLAEIRRQAAKIEVAKMREHIKAKRRKLGELELNERTWTKARKAERKARLRKLRETIRGAADVDGRYRKSKLLEIDRKRKAFEAWWREVRLERETRLSEIRMLRAELREWTKEGPARRKESIAQITAEAQRQLAKFDAETAAGLDALGDAVRKARAELRSDEYDLRQWTSNRKRDVARGQAPKAVRRQTAEELESNVEHNLETPEEWAWWRRNKRSLLRQAKELGKTSGDEIAEMIREAVGDNPEEALNYLADDADAWVEAEIRRQGFAA